VDETHDERTALSNIQRAQEDLKMGVIFDSLAKELGWIPRGRMPEELEKEIFGLELRENSSILRSDAGYHIIRVTERRAEGIPELASIREHLEGMLLRMRHQAVIEEFIDGLKAKADIRTR
jgi:parvulin-like peptidyl-prolyl isomerase